MTKPIILSVFSLMLLAGCKSGSREVVSQSAASNKASESEPSLVAVVDYQQPSVAELIESPEAIAEPERTTETLSPQPLPPTNGLTLEVLEQVAFAENPAIAQAAARIRALRGKCVQVGLPPNPTVGYVASEVGDDGAAGQQGGFIGQEFITAKKLQRNRAVVASEIKRAEQQLAAVQKRVQTDVRQAYYAALLAQRRIELAQELVRITTEAVNASKSLVDAEELALAGLLQTEVRQQNASVLLGTAQNNREQVWRRLSAVVGGNGLPVQTLEGDVTKLPDSLNWNEQIARLQSQSPEVAAAMASVERAQRALRRACVEAVPNINTQLSVQFDNATEDTIAGVQVGVPVPIWNRNQGGIRQANAEVSEAIRNVQRVELNLNHRLADAFQRYADAHITATNYASNVLPRAEKTFQLVQQGFTQGEVGYLDLLAAQQTFSQTNLAYLDALGLLWQSYAEIDGLLLTGSLESVDQ